MCTVGPQLYTDSLLDDIPIVALDSNNMLRRIDGLVVGVLRPVDSYAHSQPNDTNGKTIEVIPGTSWNILVGNEEFDSSSVYFSCS